MRDKLLPTKSFSLGHETSKGKHKKEKKSDREPDSSTVGQFFFFRFRDLITLPNADLEGLLAEAAYVVAEVLLKQEGDLVLQHLLLLLLPLLLLRSIDRSIIDFPPTAGDFENCDVIVDEWEDGKGREGSGSKSREDFRVCLTRGPATSDRLIHCEEERRAGADVMRA